MERDISDGEFLRAFEIVPVRKVHRILADDQFYRVLCFRRRIMITGLLLITMIDHRTQKLFVYRTNEASNKRAKS